MKSTYSRRYRRNPSNRRESAMFKKDNQPEHTFFAAPSHESFFKPKSVQRKCAHCEAEDKQVKRMTDAKEEEKKIQRQPEKKEEGKKLQRQPEKKEEEKKLER